MTTRVGKEWASVIYRANCADCGEVVIRAAESSLHVTGPQSSWRCTFSCPVCRRDALWPISAGAGHLLVAGGAQVTVQVAVQGITLLQHIDVDGNPHGCRNKCWRPDRSSNIVEVPAPRCEVADVVRLK